jgi:hypothetical protein
MPKEKGSHNLLQNKRLENIQPFKEYYEKLLLVTAPKFKNTGKA